jgi:UDP-N-acetylglucosamine--N-acetylmuramyl-(pentapeptide) pyrophosphoryl-undecaprenol N-acetylglucosamine transferase
MKIIIAAGGTGGHLYPALAAAKMFLNDPNVKLLFVGGKGSLEERKINDAGIPYKGITVRKFLRRRIISMPSFISSLFAACAQSFFIVIKFKPDVVVGMGGYVSGPILLISALCGIPTFIHEQNTVAGLTNRILAKFVSKIGITFETSKKYFPGYKVELTGNPVREEVLLARKDTSIEKLGLDPGKKTVFVFGGSHGARKINIAILDAIKFLSNSNLQILHITGPEDYDFVKSAVIERRISTIGYFIYPYLDNIWDALVSADLVVSRAGATSIAEITVKGIPSILIPYPYASDNHQELNSRVLEEKCAARVLLDRELTGESLAHEILSLIDKEENMRSMSCRSKSFGQPDATRKMVNIVYRLAEKHGKNK